jgi:hypothetical protein
VPTRPLCIADVHLRNAFALPSLAVSVGGVTLMKAKACVAECYMFQQRHSECESICRDILQVSCCSHMPTSMAPHAHICRTTRPRVSAPTRLCLGRCYALEVLWLLNSNGTSLRQFSSKSCRIMTLRRAAIVRIRWQS